MDQHPVPQNITGFQFKLIGDMTIKQFVMLAIGILLAYLATLPPWPAVFKWPVAFSFAFTGFAFAFMPFEERSLDRWLIAFFKAVYLPTQFLWKKNPSAFAWLTLTTVQLVSSKPSPDMVKSTAKLDSYLKSLPSQPQSPLDKIEASTLKSLDFELGETLMTIPIAPPFIPPPEKSLIIEIPEEAPPLPKVRVRKLKASLKGEIILPPIHPKKTLVDIKLPVPHLPKVAETVIKETTLTPKAPTQIIGSVMPPVPAKHLSPTTASDSEEAHPAVDPNIKPQTDKITEGPLSPTAKEEIKKLKMQNDLLNTELNKFQEQINALQEFAVQTSEGKLRLKEMLTKYEEAQKQREFAINELSGLKRRLEEAKKETVSPAQKKVGVSPRVQYISQLEGQKSGIPTTQQFPNVLAGIISDTDGNILANVIITVKDKNDNPVRAIKSNQLGQFKTGTPLLNGKYTIELEKDNYKFDIIGIEAKGDILPLLEIKAK